MEKDRKKIKVALFGSGKMGTHHIRAIQSYDAAELLAVADPQADSEKLKALLPEKAEIFSSAEELLKIVKPDVVHVCTPPHTHSLLAKLALKSGAHVYVEKPFALNKQEASEVITLAKNMGKKICAGHQLLFEEPIRKVNTFIKQLGHIVHVESYFSFNVVRRSQDGRTAVSPFEQLVDILPHPVYLLLHFLKLNLPQEEDNPAEIISLQIESTGNIHGIIRCGNTTGVIVVTLKGRPIESYVRVVGTNGNMFADFVTGTVTKLIGPGISGVSKAINPFSQAWQSVIETTQALFKRVFKKQKSYPGLVELITAFYENLEPEKPSVIKTSSILDTVTICEEVGRKLKNVEVKENAISEEMLRKIESDMKPPDISRGGVLVTGGTGLLGKKIASELRKQNWLVRVITRRIPPASARIPGVEYVVADLSQNNQLYNLNGISTVVHCAAETAGGMEAHERNSIGTTRNILMAMDKAGVKKFIYISSIAVLKSSYETGEPSSEDTPLDIDCEDRGPYVWGKVKSERLAADLCANLMIDIRIIRPGPIIDFKAFEAPGRLGREVGNYFVAIGSKRSSMHICDIKTAVKIIRNYVENFSSSPPVLNLIEPNPSTRSELVSCLLEKRSELKVLWVPSFIVTIASPLLKLLQLIIRPGKPPVDIRAAFVSEKYKSDLVAEVIQLADSTQDMN